MKILAIETSCDDTSIAILDIKKHRLEILSNIVSSQAKLHAKYGGVFPSLAKREHQKNLPLVLKKALQEARSASRRTKIDAIAVTIGPGLEPCLWTGINFAKELAEKLKKPLIPVNHIEAHILANFVGGNSKLQITNSKKIFPAVCLVVSGGHTQLILMKNFGKYEILGETRDDAAGECFDKVARILGLGYPGGPVIAAEAAKYNIQHTKYRIRLPRPMINTKDYDFSFSGLKTAVLYLVKNMTSKKRLNKKEIQEICFETQQAIIDVLIRKTLKAAKNHKAKSIILGGGVAANKELRKQFKEKVSKEIPYSKLYIPNSKFCTDNAVMAAISASFHFKKKKTPKENLRFPTGQGWKKIVADANLRIDGKIL